MNPDPASKPQGSEQPKELPPSLNIFEAIERLFSLAGIAQEPGWNLYDSNIRRKLDEVRERMQELYAKPLPTPSADEEVETPRTDHEQRAYRHTDESRPVKASFARELERELTQLRQKHNAERGTRFTPSKLNTKYLQQIASLKSELATAQKELADSERDNAALRRERETLTEQWKQYLAEKLKLQSELATAQANQAELQQSLYELQKNILGREVPNGASAITVEWHRIRKELQTAMEEAEKVTTAAQVLVDKLAVIHDNSTYRAVWEIAQFRTGVPYNGPTYTEELKSLNALLSRLSSSRSTVRKDNGL